MAGKTKQANVITDSGMPTSTAGYFRQLFRSQPEMLNADSKAILQRWQTDHSGQIVTKRISDGLHNVKSNERKRLAGTKAARSTRGNGMTGRRGKLNAAGQVAINPRQTVQTLRVCLESLGLAPATVTAAEKVVEADIFRQSGQGQRKGAMAGSVA